MCLVLGKAWLELNKDHPFPLMTPKQMSYEIEIEKEIGLIPDSYYLIIPILITNVYWDGKGLLLLSLFLLISIIIYSFKLN